MNIDPDLYHGWQDRPIKEYTEEMTNPQSHTTQRYIAFYNKMWKDIGPLNLLFWVRDEGGYGYYGIQDLWDELPWQLRMRLRAHNVRIVYNFPKWSWDLKTSDMFMSGTCPPETQMCQHLELLWSFGNHFLGCISRTFRTKRQFIEITKRRLLPIIVLIQKLDYF